MSRVTHENDYWLSGGFEPCPDCHTATWCAHLGLCLSMTTPHEGAGYGALRDAAPPAPTEAPAPDLEALLVKIRRWREDHRAGYDGALELLCEADEALTAALFPRGPEGAK